jgi:hypothetical protein
MRTSTTDFLLHTQLVHGSFFTQASFVMRSATAPELNADGPAPELKATINADQEGFNLWFEGMDHHFPKLASFRLANYTIESLAIVKTVVESSVWSVEITRSMIRAPLAQTSWRLDSKVKMLVDEEHILVWPHGLLGQTWDGSGLAIDGQQDDYQHGGHEFTTHANMEGAIEGELPDYEVDGPFGTNFKFSRFQVHVSTPPRDVSKLFGQKRMAMAGLPQTAGTADEDEE